LVPTGSVCGYCGRSLGCHEHRVSIERHVDTYCLATEKQRAELHAAPPDMKQLVTARIVTACQALPKPWPAPVPPWDDAGPAPRWRLRDA
jgi:hypothetical protein